VTSSFPHQRGACARLVVQKINDAGSKTRQIGTARQVIRQSGLRTRRESREHDNKINYLIDLQIRNEELQKHNEERFSKLAESQASLAESQSSTDRRLDALIDIIKEGRNGNSMRNN
jgi:hypothetical protein